MVVVHPFSYTVSTLEEHCLSVVLWQVWEVMGSDTDTVEILHLVVMLG